MGDVVLKGVAGELDDAARKNGGFAGRWGGEEFFIVLPEIEGGQAYNCAEELRQNVSAIQFKDVGNVTISLGVITVNVNFSQL